MLLTPQTQQHALTPPVKHTVICGVDDSHVMRKIIETTMHNLGFRVYVFPDGMQFCTWLAETQMMPDLILLDIQLPTFDGYQIAQHLHKYHHYCDIPLIMLSGKDSTSDRIKGRVAGAKAYLVKPFTVQTLITFVLAVLQNQEVPLQGMPETFQEPQKRERKTR